MKTFAFAGGVASCEFVFIPVHSWFYFMGAGLRWHVINKNYLRLSVFICGLKKMGYTAKPCHDDAG